MGFDGWLDRFFEAYYRRRPVNATFIGNHAYDHLLPDYSPDGMTDTVDEMRALLNDLDALPDEDLTDAQYIDRRLAEGFLRIQLWEFGSQHFQRANPTCYTGEAIFGVMALFLRDFGPLPDRVDAAIERMQAIPEFLEQGMENIQQAPEAWIEKALDECNGGLKFFRGGIDQLMTELEIEAPELRKSADRAAESITAFQRWLADDLSRRATHNYACGAAALNLYLQQGHFLEQSAAEILAYAEQRFTENLARLENGATEFGAVDWQTALTGLAEHHPTVENYYQSYQQVWQACRETADELDLLNWPEYPIRYVPRPAWSKAAAPHLYFLFYRSPAAFDNVGVVDYLVEPIEPDMPATQQIRLLRSTNDSVIKLNHVVHHGSIGHHVQNWHAFRAESRIGKMAAVDCASRIAMFCGGTMAEGWACYATDLMDEIGFLTPLESYSMRYSRMRMAARAICDIKLHSGQFNLAETISFYRDSAGMSPEAARSEAVKNSMFPGTALMYLTGTDLIHSQRKQEQSRLGGQFSLRDFHDGFLSRGSIPVALAPAPRATLSNSEKE